MGAARGRRPGVRRGAHRHRLRGDARLAEPPRPDPADPARIDLPAGRGVHGCGRAPAAAPGARSAPAQAPRLARSGGAAHGERRPARGQGPRLRGGGRLRRTRRRPAAGPRAVPGQGGSEHPLAGTAGRDDPCRRLGHDRHAAAAGGRWAAARAAPVVRPVRARRGRPGRHPRTAAFLLRTGLGPCHPDAAVHGPAHDQRCRVPRAAAAAAAAEAVRRRHRRHARAAGLPR